MVCTPPTLVGGSANSGSSNTMSNQISMVENAGVLKRLMRGIQLFSHDSQGRSGPSLHRRA